MNTPQLEPYEKVCAKRAIVKEIAEQLFSTIEDEIMHAMIKDVAEKRHIMKEATWEYEGIVRHAAMAIVNKK